MNWLRRFMRGRYGTDQLSIAFIVVFIILNVISWFTSTSIIYIPYLILFGLFVFRMLSKNIAARQRENYQFLKIWNPIRSRIMKFFLRLKNMKSYKYFKCAQCKHTLRVPRGKNKIRVTCPHCGHKEIIKT